jgi:hypothetical protein
MFVSKTWQRFKNLPVFPPLVTPDEVQLKEMLRQKIHNHDVTLEWLEAQIAVKTRERGENGIPPEQH